MNNHSRLARYAACAAGLIGLTVGLPSFAANSATGEALRPNERTLYVGATVTRDDNVFRLEDEDRSEAFLGESDLDDLVIEAYGGGALQLRSRGREIELGAHIFRRDFSDYTDFSHTGGRAVAQVDWDNGGPNIYGVGYRFDRRQRDFINQLRPDEDLRTRQALRANYGRRLSLQWKTEARLELADISFDDATDLDQQQVRLTWTVDYETRLQNTIGFLAEYVEADFDDGDLRNFDELLLGPTLTWSLTPQTSLNGRLSYKERNQDDPTRSDFSGITGDISLVRRANREGTRYRLRLRREISNLQDEIDDFAVITGISLEPQWRLSAKRKIAGIIGFERRDFRSNAPFAVAGTSGREDDLLQAGFTYTWTPTDQLELTGAYRYWQRDSNRDGGDFDSNAFTFGVNWKFR